MPDLLASAPLAGATSGVLSVSTLNRLVRDCLESAFPLSWISGEITNLTFAASGHVYFTLKDAQAQVRCVMWRSRAQTLGWRPENGQKVEARALVSFYEPRGEFQLNVENLRRAGMGNLHEQFLALKEKLTAEGLFASDSKRPLPSFPKHLAIVTSLQAAALRDVLTTLHRRAPQIALSIFPTLVQGEGAGIRIAEAIGQASASQAEAIILCRGGGSLEDLWAFNEEVVARAIRASRLPVVTGVGHETDFTIADFAADLRAPTPTAAAEILSPDRQALLQHLESQHRRLQRLCARRLGDYQQHLDNLARRLVHPAERLARQHESLLALDRRLSLALGRLQESARQKLTLANSRLLARRPQPAQWQTPLTHLAHRLRQGMAAQLHGEKMKLQGLSASLRQLDPQAVLSRGYAIAFDAEGRAVRDSASLAPKMPLQLRLARGSAEVRVTRCETVVDAPERQ